MPELSQQVRDRLAADPLGWLTTVSRSGRPSPRPVWFLWDGDRCVLYSQPEAASDRWPGLLDKYADVLVRIGMSAEHFVSTYTVAVQVVPQRAWTID